MSSIQRLATAVGLNGPKFVALSRSRTGSEASWKLSVNSLMPSDAPVIGLARPQSGRQCG